MGSLLPVVKPLMAIVAGIPVSKIANDIIKNNVTVVTKIDKVKVVTGSAVIGMMVSQSVMKTTDQLVDSVVEATNRLRGKTETPEIEES